MGSHERTNAPHHLLGFTPCSVELDGKDLALLAEFSVWDLSVQALEGRFGTRHVACSELRARFTDQAALEQ
jgi:hypothetical protein